MTPLIFCGDNRKEMTMKIILGHLYTLQGDAGIRLMLESYEPGNGIGSVHLVAYTDFARGGFFSGWRGTIEDFESTWEYVGSFIRSEGG